MFFQSVNSRFTVPGEINLGVVGGAFSCAALARGVPSFRSLTSCSIDLY